MRTLATLSVVIATACAPIRSTITRSEPEPRSFDVVPGAGLTVPSEEEARRVEASIDYFQAVREVDPLFPALSELSDSARRRARSVVKVEQIHLATGRVGARWFFDTHDGMLMFDATEQRIEVCRLSAEESARFLRSVDGAGILDLRSDGYSRNDSLVVLVVAEIEGATVQAAFVDPFTLPGEPESSTNLRRFSDVLRLAAGMRCGSW